MVLQQRSEIHNTADIMATIDQCEEILSTIGSLATAQAFEDLYDELVRQRERTLSPLERTELEQEIEKVRCAWWQAKCRSNNDGAATLRKLVVHSSQLHTGA